MTKIHLSDHFSFGRLVLFALPNIITMVISNTYSIVDGYFISNFSGKSAFSSVNIIMPFLMAIASFGYMFGAGGSALISSLLGKKEKEKADQVFTFLVFFLLGLGIVLSITAYFLMNPVARMLGANDSLIDNCVLYGQTVILAMPLLMVGNAFQTLYVTSEKAHIGLISSLTCGIFNVLGDFLLVYVFKLGLKGAAIATVCAWCAAGLIPLIYYSIRKNTSLLHFRKCPFDFKSLGKAMGNGSSEMLSNLSTSIVSICFNSQLMKLYGEDGVAAYGVIMYVSYIYLAVFLGYSISINPLIGYHYGSNNKEEVRNILHKSLILNIITGLVMMVLAEACAKVFANIFVSYDEDLCNLTTKALRLYSFCFIFSGINIFTSSFFTGLNDGLDSAIISFSRALVFELLAIYTLPLIFGTEAIWLSLLMSEILLLIVTVTLLLVRKKKYGYGKQTKVIEKHT